MDNKHSDKLYREDGHIPSAQKATKESGGQSGLKKSATLLLSKIINYGGRNSQVSSTRSQERACLSVCLSVCHWHWPAWSGNIELSEEYP
jgi:hypothetical protein